MIISKLGVCSWVQKCFIHSIAIQRFLKDYRKKEQKEQKGAKENAAAQYHIYWFIE